MKSPGLKSMTLRESGRRPAIPARLWLALLLAALLLPDAARSAPRERFVLVPRDSPGQLEIGGSLSLRSMQQSSPAEEMTASGAAPRLHLRGEWFPGGLPIGLDARLSFERFVLSGQDVAGTAVALPANAWELAGGLAARKVWGGDFSVAGGLGWGLGSEPLVETSAAATRLAAASYHGPFASLSIGWQNGFAPRLRARGMPVLFGEGGWRGAVGAEVGFGLLDWLGASWAPVLAYDWSLARYENGGRSLEQSSHLISLALRTSFRAEPTRVELPPPTGPGTLRGRVVFAEDGKPAAGLALEVAGRAAQTDAEGRFELAQLGPGAVLLRAKLPGFRDVEQQVEVPAEDLVETELKLVRRSGPGTIRGRIVALDPLDDDRQIAVSGAQLSAPGVEATSAADGSFVLQGAGPGPVALTITAVGFRKGEEMIAVPPETETAVDITLVRMSGPAVLRGVVRGRDGVPVLATVKVVQAKRSAKTDKAGNFRLTVPGGTYRVVVTAPGYQGQTKTVVVGDGDQAIFNIDLRPQGK